MKLEISTPSENIAPQEVDSVTLPAYKGETQVLPGHTQLVTTLTEGELVLQKSGQNKRYHIQGGIADIKQDYVLVLCDSLSENA